MNPNNEQYVKYVSIGKELVKKLEVLVQMENCYQATIAKMAVEVCTIRHGGISNNIYTIKDYSNDIGLHYRTVQGWVAIYRNVLSKIDIENPSMDDWRKANKLNNLMKKERTIINKSLGKPGSLEVGKINVPKEKVKDLFFNIDEKPFVSECLKAIQSVKHINFVLNKRDIGIAQEMHLIELMKQLDNASDLINDYLTSKQKQKVS